MEKTWHASAERTDPETIMENSKVITSLPYFTEVFGAINVISAVIDKNRQVVYSNNEFIKAFGFESVEDLLGKRPGEAISCLHATELASGCGTSKACAVCGAVNALLESQKTGEKVIKEASIATRKNGQNISYVLRVISTPLNLAGEQYYLLTMEDISDEKRRATLERIFFHDVLNMAGSLNGLLSVLKDGTDPEEVRNLIRISEETSRNLVEEIMTQRQMRSAEAGDLEIKIEKLNTLDVLNSAVNKMKYHDSANGKAIVLDENAAKKDFDSDRILLQRILINLMKNALEATPGGGTIYAGCRNEGQAVAFWVKNSTVMPAEVQLQVFQRAFTTKGRGRGTGTYSVKLLTENYLKGSVSFISNETDGTVFTVTL
jgi:signal transduction histidine kinase